MGAQVVPIFLSGEGSRRTMGVAAGGHGNMTDRGPRRRCSLRGFLLLGEAGATEPRALPSEPVMAINTTSGAAPETVGRPQGVGQNHPYTAAIRSAILP